MIAAIYARKSTDQSGVADEQKSVARQVEHARQYATRKGWIVADEHVYVDDGVSGAEFANRPGFLRLMNTLKPRPRFDVLVMSEESRLGREMIQTAAALREITRAGVRVFFYLEDRERTLSTPAEKFMMSATAFADELERDKARQRVHDTMRRKFEQRHVTGGQCFGYRNVDVTAPGPDGRQKRQYVRREIHDGEAAIVRRIFELCAAGEGLKNITKRLNAERAAAPRAQQGRPRAWAPTSVRAVLHRDAYRGVLIWNRSRKRNSDGEKRYTRRPPADWMRVEAPELRIVSEDLWAAAQGQLTKRAENYRRWRQDGSGAPDGRGVRNRYLLSGIARCEACGGSMVAVSRLSGPKGSKVRRFRYVCSAYWTRGAAICASQRMARMEIADEALRTLVATEVLQPNVITRALDQAVAVLQTDERARGRALQLKKARKRLNDVEGELANLADTAARGGAVPIVLEHLNRKDVERQSLTREIAALEREPDTVALEPRALRRQLQALLDDWQALLVGELRESRDVLNSVLRDRIVFRPQPAGEGDGFEMIVPIRFDRVLRAVLPGDTNSRHARLGTLHFVEVPPVRFPRLFARR